MATMKMHERRHKVANRDGWRCHYCTVKTSCGTCDPTLPLRFDPKYPGQPVVATLDHVLPRSRGGTAALRNLVIACAECNNKKGDGLWPSLDDAGPLDRHLKRRRMHYQPFGSLVEPHPRKGRSALKSFATEELAQAMVYAVKQTYERDVKAYKCPKCSWWHVARPDHAPMTEAS